MCNENTFYPILDDGLIPGQMSILYIRSSEMEQQREYLKGFHVKDLSLARLDDYRKFMDELPKYQGEVLVVKNMLRWEGLTEEDPEGCHLSIAKYLKEWLLKLLPLLRQHEVGLVNMVEIPDETTFESVRGTPGVPTNPMGKTIPRFICAITDFISDLTGVLIGDQFMPMRWKQGPTGIIIELNLSKQEKL